jgi:magnesium-transporting ATPase (P-type)
MAVLGARNQWKSLSLFTDKQFYFIDPLYMSLPNLCQNNDENDQSSQTVMPAPQPSPSSSCSKWPLIITAIVLGVVILILFIIIIYLARKKCVPKPISLSDINMDTVIKI